MKKLYSVLLVLVGAALLATFGIATVSANSGSTQDQANQSVTTLATKDAYYTKAAYASGNTATAKQAKNVINFSGVSNPGTEMKIADLFVGNGNSDVTRTVGYHVYGNQLEVNTTDLPEEVSEYYVTLSADGKTATVTETKNGVTRTRVGFSANVADQKLAANANN
ncbi:hypothetical protein ACFQ5J_05925 [Lacticaseibacillus baoqingensis]|uniref:Uncharacterized protein n=1 Tax=Lacticaseibacillus baoqingensis TaxID=2486013 RepID=A0ABW4E4E7_9LACO|nr:hypothetical protein [Lacticaseibacillus baoqingensis]